MTTPQPFTPGFADALRSSVTDALIRQGLTPTVHPERNATMGMHALVIDKQEAELAAAVDRANSWVETARPVIKAYLALDQIHGDLQSEEFKRRGNRRFNVAASYPEMTCRDAGGDVSKAVEALARSIDDIRSDILGDEKLNASQHADDAEWDRVEAFNEVLDRECMTVDAAVKLVGDAL